ncbi:alpha/beta hydrolase [Actinoallomurus soli]|uniref:alpha/beta hydrolase n=1 Tax=Actinoallomurus soli TaxID=2952535 RepID=UPI00209260FA|nr:alpha/beta hydrolase-fold protein [Actinoallomurus soli]MCO5970115.1 esterase family protein [Actinoallomurus soli]
MFGPQGFVTFTVLVASFMGALYWLVKTRLLALRMVAGVVAFAPAMLFGVALVNRFYGYYQSWDDAWRDLTNQAPAAVARVPDLGDRLDQVLGEAVKKRQARKNGFAMETVLNGAKSHIVRQGIIWLPPQYFQRQYATTRFPVVELLHGAPGNPGDYEGRLKISGMFRKLMAAGKAKPAVLVIPDVGGGRDRATQCLDTVGGEQDETYTAYDVPDLVAARLRVQPPGPAWAIAGFSEGGYCAANLGVRHPDRYGIAASLSGYYEPLRYNKLPQQVDPFGGNKALREANSPLKVLGKTGYTGRLPHFWVMTGSGVQVDLVQAHAFVDLVRRYQPDVPFMIVKGGQHNYGAWREAFPKLFEWATPKLWTAATCTRAPGRTTC